MELEELDETPTEELNPMDEEQIAVNDVSSAELEFTAVELLDVPEPGLAEELLSGQKFSSPPFAFAPESLSQAEKSNAPQNTVAAAITLDGRKFIKPPDLYDQMPLRIKEVKIKFNIISDEVEEKPLNADMPCGAGGRGNRSDGCALRSVRLVVRPLGKGSFSILCAMRGGPLKVTLRRISRVNDVRPKMRFQESS